MNEFPNFFLLAKPKEKKKANIKQTRWDWLLLSAI